ncbi:putative UDP-glucosyltransferase [Gregarina niphandrodes]|uniref:UDP-glucosyltransferase n=1 Tax=Gregarina niphandrodes TaxID=110365 RepID=A0A023AXW4_GRENI|nr:putative UDP-glucosyltransferase [Gregarina niphandrodes]EZG43308.1 putative UDP-glucosyltransferase [Gregarina niphandrodes]|eukprot:XP_011133437.1 putative UDP-glucosyltransferase [Gregarina niphandrodes]
MSEDAQKMSEDAHKSGDIESWLPENYINRNCGKIKIISWVDQVAVLKHKAVRVFLSHSGWNGTLEAMSSFEGPIVCLPLGAEQAMNAKIQEEYFKNGLRVWQNGRTCSLKDTSIREVLRKAYNCFCDYSKVSCGLNLVSQFAFKNTSKCNLLHFIGSIPK